MAANLKFKVANGFFERETFYEYSCKVSCLHHEMHDFSENVDLSAGLLICFNIKFK